MSKKFGNIFSLFLIFSLTLSAKSLLYKVNSKTATVYVLGSVHLAKSELYPLAKEIEEAYSKSDALVVELDPDSAESMEVIMNTVQTSAVYLDGKTLKTELTAKTYNVLKSYTSKNSLPLEAMETMRPWMVMLQLTVSELMRLGYSPEMGIDKHFLDNAKANKKEVIELETAKEQMDLLSKNDKEFQDKLLLYTIESMQELEPMIEKMFTAWESGDAKSFEKIIEVPIDSDPSLKNIYDELITKRNYKMTKKIEGFLKTKKTYFVVVGSGHVVGKEGIVDLLEKKGYKLEQK